jgi:glycosyltransferase involved in cell wall biosynthesis
MKLSIITINFNNKEGLQKTIESVVSQTFADSEYIIIDGGSTDGSVDIIRQYTDKITYWVSEPDAGIYNAMNKGIRQAKGDYCLFLNSGDWLIKNDSLQYVFDEMFEEKDIVYYDVLTEYGEYRYSDKLTLYSFFSSAPIGHQSSFIKRSLFSRIGLYNEEWKIVSDWEFFLLAIINYRCTYKHYSYLLTHFNWGGISSTNAALSQEESNAVLKKQYPMMYDDYKQFVSMSNEIIHYRNSRLVQFVRRFQKCKLFKWINHLFVKS